MTFKMTDFTLKDYVRNGFKAYLDPIRKKLLIATPEEEVRVKFLYFLMQNKGVPVDKLETEVPMTRFAKGASGRTDILGHFYCQERKGLFRLFLVECKAPGIPLTDRVLAQALRYESILEVYWIFLTNGVDTVAYQYDFDTNMFNCVKGLPSYEEMLSGEPVTKSDAPTVNNYKRPRFESLMAKENREAATYFGWLGKGSPDSNHPFLLNLAGLLYDLSDTLKLPINTPWFRIIEIGYRYTTFGNAAGGGWTGDYRYFVIEDKQGQNQVISIGVMGKVFGDENPKFPNSNGHTMLIIAIDDFEKSHNSLQMDLDKFTVRVGSEIELWHDGTITAGKSGRLKNSIVMDYLKHNDPTLVKNGKIYLGSLPTNRNITWLDAEKLIVNCIRYALLRDEIRKSV